MVYINKNAKTLTNLQHQVLIGSLLGDGCLGIRKDSISPRLTIRRQINDLPYLEWQFEVFRNLCRDKAITTGKVWDERYQKFYPYCNLESRYIPAFKEYHNKWYGTGEKRIPKDLKLTPLIIAVWLCDDAHVRVSKINEKRLGIKFHTQGFTEDDVLFLQKLLNDRYNIKFTMQMAGKNKKGWTISGSDHQTRLLLKDIDNVFPISMTRKSDVWRNKTTCFYENEPKQFQGHIIESINTDILYEKLSVINHNITSDMFVNDEEIIINKKMELPARRSGINYRLKYLMNKGYLIRTGKEDHTFLYTITPAGKSFFQSSLDGMIENK
jgi:hypothetical protein